MPSQNTNTNDMNTAPKSLFPDGLKTSGQHNPIYSQLTPPSQFPKQISGPTVWKAEDYRDHPERWTHAFSKEEIEELGGAAEGFIGSGRGLTAMAKVCCFPFFSSFLPVSWGGFGVFGWRFFFSLFADLVLVSMNCSLCLSMRGFWGR